MTSVTLENKIDLIKNIIGTENYLRIKDILYSINTTEKEKKKRTKNTIPLNERCLAKRNGGTQCSRRKRPDCDYCGTHMKGTPHGKTIDKVQKFKKVNVYAEDIDGIVYFIDDFGNVYNSEDVHKQKNDPRVISKYVKDGEKILIINS